jgi:hypothetical protein
VNASYYREERTRTVVRHVIETPAMWTDVQKLLRTVLRDMGRDGHPEPGDDEVWYEVDDDSLAICYELVTGITDPDQAAEDTIGWLIKAGWRPWPALADKPPAFVPRGTDTARAAAMERIRATFAERKAQR